MRGATAISAASAVLARQARAAANTPSAHGDRRPEPLVLCIAGFDPTGGAGLLADVRALTAVGVRAAGAVTALTRQRPVGRAVVQPLPAPEVARTVASLLTDLRPEAIKIGMVATAATARALARLLRRRAATTPIVLDPVLAAGAGGRLATASAASAIAEELAPLATVLTPNLPEAEALLRRPIRTGVEMRAAMPALLALGARHVLLKGGHLATDPVDVLSGPDGERRWRRRRIGTREAHGTGCTLASLIAAGLAQGLTVGDAVDRAIRRLEAALRTAWRPQPEGWAFLGPWN
jgi:hydroxymethylpyrimidine/phosphomethylpyrimidine kinase